MIVEYIRYRVPADQVTDLAGAYRSVVPTLDASPHCLGYELSTCTEEPGVVVVRMEWDSAEGHLAGFRRSAGFRTFFAAVRPFVEAIEEMRHYEVELVGGRLADRVVDEGVRA